MKILYAIQATGNGHISRAREIVPHLLNHGEVDLLISGRQADVSLPYLIRYKKRGLSYTFGKKGRIDMVDSVKQLRPFELLRDIYTFPVHDYDIMINDFEPVTAWACQVKRKSCIALSHQASYLSKLTPRAKPHNGFAEAIFRHYAPATAAYGFHFKSFDTFIYTPVIRSEIRALEPTRKNHITIYLPAHADEVLLPHLNAIPFVEFQVYSKHAREKRHVKNVQITPVENEGFIRSMASGNGLITAGGFESVAEALHLQKRVMVIPMTDQYEQLCNAVAAAEIGVTHIPAIAQGFSQQIRSWLENDAFPRIHYPDLTAGIVETVIRDHQMAYSKSA